MSSTGRHYDVASRFELTERQRQVLDLIAAGRTNAEIADTLGITLDGAKFHVREILGKLQVDSREEAAELWRKRGGRLGRVWRQVTGAMPVAAAKVAAGVAGLLGVTVVGLALYSGLAGGGDTNTSADAASADASCADQVGLSIDTSTGAAGAVVINLRHRNVQPDCDYGDVEVRVRLANHPAAPEIAAASLGISWAHPPTGDGLLMELFWQNACGITGPVEIHVQVGQAEAATTATVIPSCVDATKPSTLSPVPSANVTPTHIPLPPTQTPPKTAATPPTCDPNPAPLQMSYADRPDGAITINVHAPKPTCHPPDSEGLQIYDLGGPSSSVPVFPGIGVIGGTPDASVTWSNGCGFIGPFRIQASLLGEQGTLLIDHAPACTDPKAPLGSTLSP